MTELGRDCKKHRYANEQSARQKLGELRKKRRHHRNARTEDRPYHCPYCRAWHLTSQPFEV